MELNLACWLSIHSFLCASEDLSSQKLVRCGPGEEDLGLHDNEYVLARLNELIIRVEAKSFLIRGLNLSTLQTLSASSPRSEILGRACKLSVSIKIILLGNELGQTSQSRGGFPMTFAAAIISID